MKSDAFFEGGALGGCKTFVDYQLLTEWCGENNPFDGEDEFWAAPSPLPDIAPDTTRLAYVLADYQSEPESTFQGLRYHVRENTRSLLRRIDERHGHWKLTDIDTRELKAWYKVWSADGKLASGHAFGSQLRTALTHGYLMLKGPERYECDRIRNLLRSMKFSMPPAREERLTADQATKIREVAHRHFGWPSIALSQAFQFELMLRQKDAIGEVVPESEPGETDVRFQGKKWLRGLRWEEIDENLILRHITSKRQKPIMADLRLCPMVMFEFAIYTAVPVDSLTRAALPASGPIVICDVTGLPWTGNEFRRKWRLVANHAGVPKTVFSMDSRAGGITEAFEAGADEDQIRQAATHSSVNMTQRYNRRSSLETISDVQNARVENRKKARTEPETDQ